ncbi:MULTISPECIES: glycosyltransferase family 4 protein [Variovorax]|uniref:Glycosyltransferase involved in cell wall biosynthesis n=2 Tax=Variovorax TaxID=34072 RepID=A0AAE3XU67_VARPD|nr:MULTISPECIES: glycosyltransferase family 4 protein [Variovorax]MBD9663661.1 glycosyltransferase family 4 protein [Variovorax sp. VRV01]MDP9967422.1 glycosyltransferase involved in cell wall biosynthesis [Variovorax paradoxus]MDR6424409.1 glycosyltransferase involved in cell wall biosynthesis [Variovorax paradoxus]MDR6452317.1 glycosyltransferase involved in cell wall biosynthesis [Variovorax paradoxus]
MKILHVAETLKGGLETYLRLVSGFQQNSPVISQAKFILPGPVEWLNSQDTHVVPTARSPLALASYAAEIKKIIRSERPAVLHLHSSIPGGIVRALALLGQVPAETKIVYCSHGWAFDQVGPAYKKSIYRWIEWLLSHWSDAIICISGHEFRVAEKFGIKRCKCIPNGIQPIAPISENTVAPKVPARPRRVLFVGRLDRQKGIDALLDAYARVQPGFKLVIVGGAVRNDLSLARSSEIEFAGWLEKDELEEAYRSCDAVIVPSRWEGFGLVAVEAMARSKPVFASAVGGLVDIVEDNRNGRLFSLDALDDVLREIDRISDEELQRMGRAGREIFEEKYTADRMNAAILDLYKESVQ